MKEAAGEANLTVVAIILIAVVVAVATPLVRSLMKTSAKRSCCTDAGAIWEGGKCVYPPGIESDFNAQDGINTSYGECLTNSKQELDTVSSKD
jgi:hypothetical protein